MLLIRRHALPAGSAKIHAEERVHVEAQPALIAPARHPLQHTGEVLRRELVDRRPHSGSDDGEIRRLDKLADRHRAAASAERRDTQKAGRQRRGPCFARVDGVHEDGGGGGVRVEQGELCVGHATPEQGHDGVVG